MQTKAVIEHISKWLQSYADKASMKGFIVGISGGIDSAVTSCLCASTNLDVLAVHMPIHQEANQVKRATEHLKWLKKNFPNITCHDIDMTPMFESVAKSFPINVQKDKLAMANTRSRLRMLSLYAFAGAECLLVAGTGNRIEDFGVGFFTKYGDGGVDISPIGDLTKSEVYKIGDSMGISQDILNAEPTDGLWEESLSDEQRIGASYPELEWAMEFQDLSAKQKENIILDERQKEVLSIYLDLHEKTLHKISPIPVCHIPTHMKNIDL